LGSPRHPTGDSRGPTVASPGKRRKSSWGRERKKGPVLFGGVKKVKEKTHLDKTAGQRKLLIRRSVPRLGKREKRDGDKHLFLHKKVHCELPRRKGV